MRRIIPLLLLVGLLPCGSCVVRRDRPVKLVVPPYVQRPGKTAMTIMWITRGRTPAVVRYGIGGEMSRQVDVRKPAHSLPVKPAEYLYETRLTELEPGTEYTYEVEQRGHTTRSRFRTVPEKPGTWRFINYGDSRSNTNAHTRLAAQFDEHDPAFIVHSGDMVDTGAYREWKAQYFPPLEGVIDHLPVWPVVGNHEGDAVIYRKVYSLPGNEEWYSFDYGNVHFTMLGMRQHNEDMIRWCEEDLAASKAAWKIVVYHVPSYDHGRRNEKWGRKTFLPIFRRHKVDLVLCGHAHGYVRLHPMYTRGENESHPITHITSAGGGAPISSALLRDIPHMAAQARKYHFMVFTVDGETISARAISDTGKTIDEFSITKRNGRYDEAYLKKALEEQTFDSR